ncbi:MAG: ATPase [Bacteroidetes bacterium GWA2_30_7]|nr:MAG: ATPase [Bacteroidetes bacterium GWA2_30_7]
MERKIDFILQQWKNSELRLPLILHGARQVGKTYTLLNFGKSNYQNVVYFNFENNPSLQSIFSEDISPDILMPKLQLIANQSIFEESTLLFFDEIQTCERALTSLKYFAENAPKFHIVAAGSLLGVVVNRKQYSFPVGKVQIEHLYPMDFEEFLWALGKKEAIEIIKNCFNNRTECSLHSHFMDIFKLHITLGGMPQVVNEYIKNKDLNFVVSLQKNILDSYIADMAKYATAMETVKIMAAFNSIPSQLAKENRKFQYKLIKSGARANVYESSIDWLKSSGIIVKVQKCTKPEMPLIAFSSSDFFKVYLSDTGLLCSKLGLNNQNLIIQPFDLNGIKGAIAENYVASALQINGYTPYYWESEGKAEVDFIIQNKNGAIIPIEVKSSENVRAKSLIQYMQKYKPEIAYKISVKNFGLNNNLFSVPLYAVFCI